MDFFNLDSLPDSLRSEVTRRKLAVDQWLFRPRDPARSVFLIESGRFQTVRPTVGNKLSVSQSVGAGGLLGEEAFLAKCYGGGAIAKIPSTVLIYPKEAVIAALQNHADLSEKLITLLARKIQPLSTSLELREISPSHQRVLRYLGWLATTPQHEVRKHEAHRHEAHRHEAQGASIVPFDRPFKEIAAEIGFTPETLSRALVKLEQAGWISRTNSNVTLLNQVV